MAGYNYCRMMRILIPLFFVLLSFSCSTPTRKLSLPASSDGPSGEAGYVTVMENNPEMYPREHALRARRDQLRLNYATWQATKLGTCKVRAIAPPLQLTGDDNIDQAGLYRILLVADDLGLEESFLDRYEVSVGPDPTMATIEQAVSGDSIAAADAQLAQEKVDLLQMDKALLRADEAYLTNYLTLSTNRIEQIVSAGSNQLQQIDNSITNLTLQITLAETNKLDAGKGAGAVSTSVTNRLVLYEKIKMDAKIRNLKSSIAELNSIRTKSSSDLDRIYHFKNSPNVAKSAIAWHDVQETFWLNILNNAQNVAKNDSKHLAREIKSAAVISFRPQALKRLDQITINVLRKNRTSQYAAAIAGPDSEITPMVLNGRIHDSLTRMDDALSRIRIVLMMDNQRIDPASRLAVLRNRLGLFPHLIGELNASIILLTSPTVRGVIGEPDIKGLVQSESGAGAGAPTVGIAQLNEWKVTSIKSNSLGSNLFEIHLFGSITNSNYGTFSSTGSHGSAAGSLSNVNFSIAGSNILHGAPVQPAITAQESPGSRCLATVDESSQMIVDYVRIALNNAVNSSVAVLSNLNPVTIATFPGAPVALVENARQQVGAADALLKVITLSDTNAIPERMSDATDYKTPPAGSTYDLIRKGDLVVYNFNVLRGVVRTTAFLASDDDSALIFGKRFSDSFYAAQVTFRNMNDKPILIYGNTMRLVVLMTAAKPFDYGEDGNNARLNWWATFEPLDYDSVKRMLFQKDENSKQRWLSKAIDFAALAGGMGAAFTTSRDLLRGIDVFSGVFAPAAKELLEADLRRFEQNFRDKGLNNIEEIPAGSTITRFVFLPKGPIYGDYGYDAAVAGDLPQASDSERSWRPDTGIGSDQFGKKALTPTYIYNIRREEVYVEGKRILKSDPLSSSGGQ